MAGTVLGDAVDLLQSMGFFDVVLPFLLVFTIVYGILEKTKIFGTEESNGKERPKKNLNAMFAFVIAFFVLAAKEIVASIQTSLPMVALVLVAIICFLMLVGSFVSGEKEFNFMDTFKGWQGGIAIVFIIAILAIFANSFGLLDTLYKYISGGGNDFFIISVFLSVIGGIVLFVFNSDSGSKA